MTSLQPLPAFDGPGLDATHHDVEGLLRREGWAWCGAGDWAFALAAPDGDVVARISPFDPVGPTRPGSTGRRQGPGGYPGCSRIAGSPGAVTSK